MLAGVSREITTYPGRTLIQQLRRALCTPGNSTLWLHQPSNLYLIDRQADAYIDLMGYEAYAGGFHNAIHKLICQHQNEILDGLMPRVEVMDLGPGYPDKTFPLLDTLRRNGSDCRYVPVDVSRKFLSIAESACRPYGFPIEPVHCLFEELPLTLNGTRNPPAGTNRLVILGVTFMNFAPSRILPLLANLVRGDDAILLAAELYDEEHGATLLAPYGTLKAENFNFLILELLGIPRCSAEYFVRFRRKRIEMGFQLHDSVNLGDELLLAAGREIVTAISYRHTLEELRSVLNEAFGRVEIFLDECGSSAIARVSRAGAHTRQDGGA